MPDLFPGQTKLQEVLANLVTNPSAELVALGNVSASSAGQTASSSVRDSSWAKAGLWSNLYTVVRTDNVSLIGPSTPTGTAGIPVTPGRWYAARFARRWVAMGNQVVSMQCRIYWYTASGAASATPTTNGPVSNSDSVGVESETWVIGQAPADAAFASVRPVFSTANTSGLARTYQLQTDAYGFFDLGTATPPSSGLTTAAADVPAYFDGDMADYEWTGEPHTSTSRQALNAGYDPAPSEILPGTILSPTSGVPTNKDYDPLPSEVLPGLATDRLYNLIPNPSLELSAADWGAAYGTVARSTTRAKFGAASLLFTPSGTQQFVYARPATSVVLERGKTYTASVWVYFTAAPTGTTQFRITDLAVNWESSRQTLTNAALVGTWTRINLTFTVPTTGLHTDPIVFWILTSGTLAASNLIYLDGFMLTEGSTLHDYADGDTYGWRWRGAPHASVSERGDDPNRFYASPDGVFKGASGGYGAPVNKDWGGPIGDIFPGAEAERFYNLVPNPSFELDTSGWTLDGNTSRSTAQKQSGLASIRWAAAGPNTANHAYSASIPVKPGQRYTLAVWIRPDAGAAGSVNVRVDNAPLGATNHLDVAVPLSTGGGAWRREVFQFTPTGPNVSIRFTTNGATVGFHLDSIMLVEGAFTSADAPTYFDGSLGGYWQGAPHASISVSGADPNLPQSTGIFEGLQGAYAPPVNKDYQSNPDLFPASGTDYADNLLLNPSFEIDTLHWGASGAFGSGLGTVSRVTTPAPPFGSGALRIAASSGAGSSNNNIAGNTGLGTLGVGEVLTFSVYLRGDVGGEIVDVGIFHASGNLGAFSAPITLTTEWKRYTVTATVGISVPGVQVAIRPRTNSAVIYADGALLSRGSKLYQYGDGSMQYFSWAGTPHGSMSLFGPVNMADVPASVADFFRVGNPVLLRTPARVVVADLSQPIPVTLSQVISLSTFDALPGWTELGVTRGGVRISRNLSEDGFDVWQTGIVTTTKIMGAVEVEGALADMSLDKMAMLWDGSVVSLSATEKRLGAGVRPTAQQKRVVVMHPIYQGRRVAAVRAFVFAYAEVLPIEQSFNFNKSGEQQSLPFRLRSLPDPAQTDPLLRHLYALEAQV